MALAGVALPFALGYAACRLLGLGEQVSIMAAATLTATSVGITARVLADLGRLRDPEGQIILGAAVIDDVLGLLILTVVAGMAEGHEVSGYAMIKMTASTVGFLVAALLVGRVVIPPLFRWSRPDRAARDSDHHGPDRGTGDGLACPEVRLGNDHRRVRGRSLGRGGAADP